MRTNKEVEEGTELYDVGMKLMQAAYDYWEVYQKKVGSAAVVWVENDNGTFLLFTRGEYKENILRSAKIEIPFEAENMFNPFGLN